jgi:hypothetical protein
MGGLLALLAKLASVLGLVLLLTPPATELDLIPVVGHLEWLLVGYLSSDSSSGCAQSTWYANTSPGWRGAIPPVNPMRPRIFLFGLAAVVIQLFYHFPISGPRTFHGTILSIRWSRMINV